MGQPANLVAARVLDEFLVLRLAHALGRDQGRVRRRHGIELGRRVGALAEADVIDHVVEVTPLVRGRRQCFGLGLLLAFGPLLALLASGVAARLLHCLISVLAHIFVLALFLVEQDTEGFLLGLKFVDTIFAALLLLLERLELFALQPLQHLLRLGRGLRVERRVERDGSHGVGFVRRRLLAAGLGRHGRLGLVV